MSEDRSSDISIRVGCECGNIRILKPSSVENAYNVFDAGGKYIGVRSIRFVEEHYVESLEAETAYIRITELKQRIKELENELKNKSEEVLDLYDRKRYVEKELTVMRRALDGACKTLKENPLPCPPCKPSERPCEVDFKDDDIQCLEHWRDYFIAKEREVNADE